MTAPSDGQCRPSRIIEPSSTSSDGSSAIKMVSLSRSSAHMPRVILRTVEPANELACQSVEKRCTRAKESRATSDMICSVNGTIACKPVSRRIIDISPSATMAPNAVNAACRAAGSSAPRVRASTRWPENTGMNRSAMVAPSKPPATMAVRPGWLSQWRNTNGITTRIAAGRFLDRTVMASSGYASRARRLHLMDARAAAGRTHASLKETLVTRWEAWGSGRQARSMPAKMALRKRGRPAKASNAGVRSANTSKSCKSSPVRATMRCL